MRAYCRCSPVLVAKACLLVAVITPFKDLHAQGTLIPVTTRRDMIFDHAGKYLYISTSNGRVERYNLAAGQLETPYILGGFLVGADINLDDSFLLVAQRNVANDQGTFHKIDLRTGLVTDINYTLTDGEGGGSDVAITSNGHALVTTGRPIAGSGSVPLRDIDLATNVVTIRDDVPPYPIFGGNKLQPDTQIARNADATRFYFMEVGRLIFTYNAITNSFGPRVEASGYLNWLFAAVNHDGTLLGFRAMTTASLETPPTFGLVHSFNRLDSGIAFDAVKNVLYAINSSTGQVIAYDTNTFVEKFRLNIGEPVPNYSSQFGVGSMVASQDGRYLAVRAPERIRLLDTVSGTSVGIPPADSTPTPTPAPSSTPTVTVSAFPKRIREGGASGVSRISLSPASSQPIAVGFQMSGKAKEGADYLIGVHGQITIPPDLSPFGIIVRASLDRQTEKPERIRMTLLPGSGYQLGSPISATLKIINSP